MTVNIRSVNTMSDSAIIIVGAGEAGVAAAAALREAEYGGRILLLSEEQPFPYERPPLSKELLFGSAAGLKFIRPIEWYEEQRIEFRPGVRVTGASPVEQRISIETEGGVREQLSYEKLLLTTGARVRELSGPGQGVLYLRTYEDGLRLRSALAVSRSVVIVGGGVIGLEVASSARALGLTVTVVDVAPRLMARALAPEISDFVAELHRNAGVTVLTDVRSVEIESVGGARQVRLGTGETIDADLVLAGVGVVPNDELGAMAGCRIENGIVVDGAGRTSIKNIYAAGDVASFHHPIFSRPMRVEAWQHAGRHGTHVARAMAGISNDYCEVPWFWTDQHAVNIQVAGVAAQCTETVWRGEGEDRTAFHFSQGRLVAATTINNGRDMRPATKLIAAGWSGSLTELAEMSAPLGKIVGRILADVADGTQASCL